jgi:hypothetical protein
MGLSDSVSIDFAGQGSVSTDDPLGLSDAVSLALSRVKTAADNLGISDAAATAFGYVRLSGDQLGLSDLTSLQVQITRLDDDQLDLSDRTELERAPAGFTEANALTDSVLAQMEFNRDTDDQLGMTDAVTIVMEKFIVIDDALGLSDTAAGNLLVEILEALSLTLTLDPRALSCGRGREPVPTGSRSPGSVPPGG